MSHSAVGHQLRFTDPAKQTACDAMEVTQLLPPRFFARRHAIGVLSIWGLFVVTLSAIIGGLLVPAWLRGQQVREDNSRLMTDAEPLTELRQKTELLDEENKRRAKWSAWVESAKPDDSLLQTLAVIAETARVSETGIEIDAVEIQLPLEYPAKYQEPPRWAAPHLSVTAKVPNGNIARSWLESISASDRISEADSKLTPSSSVAATVQIVAQPLATRVVP